MKTLLVSANRDVPPELCDWLKQGSTSLDSVSAAELSGHVAAEALGVDRLVFWAGAGDADVNTLAAAYATGATEDERTDVLYIDAGNSRARPSGLSDDQMFRWPEDKDKLQLVLTVGNG